MPVCARTSTQPDGSLVLILDPTETNLSACPYAVSTGTESLLGQLAEIEPGDALVISLHVAAVWAIAWGFRLITKAVDYSFGETKDET